MLALLVRALYHDPERPGEDVRQLEKVVGVYHRTLPTGDAADPLQLTAPEPGTGHRGFVELRARQITSGEARTTQVGLGEISAGQIAAVEGHHVEPGEPPVRQIDLAIDEGDIREQSVVAGKTGRPAA